jgi:transcriptional regulator with GAF, ATPase, and Fis domain
VTAQIDAQALAASLRRLEERDTAVLKPSLQRIVDACVQLFGVDGSGVMLADEQGALRFAVSTDGPGRVLEDAQRDTGQGPCIDALLGDTPTVCDDIRSDGRYPVLAARLSGRAVDAVLSVPLHLSRTVVGTLNVHTAVAHRWSRSERDALSRYGEIAEAMLSAAVSADQAGELAAQLNYALDYRAPIERGVGYLMARDRLGQTAAFHRLRTAARSNRRRIGDVAEDLLRSGRLPGER